MRIEDRPMTDQGRQVLERNGHQKIVRVVEHFETQHTKLKEAVSNTTLAVKISISADAFAKYQQIKAGSTP